MDRNTTESAIGEMQTEGAQAGTVATSGGGGVAPRKECAPVAENHEGTSVIQATNTIPEETANGHRQGVESTPQTRESEFYAAASAYRRRGWRVTPLARPVPGDEKSGKKPILHDWPNRELSDADVRRYFDTDTPHNIGVVCGTASGIVVVDTDEPELFTEVLKKHPEMDDTYTVRRANAPEGRSHRYFALAEGQEAPKNLNKAGTGWGDLKSTGGQVVAPPSVHFTGGVYEVVKDVALLPWRDEYTETLDCHRKVAGSTGPDGPGLEALREAYARLPKTVQTLMRGGVEEGERNQTAFLLSGRCRAAGLTRDEAEPLIIGFCGKCRPAYDVSEALATLDSAYDHDPVSKPVVLLPREGSTVTVTGTARAMAKLLAATERYYCRKRQVVGGGEGSVQYMSDGELHELDGCRAASAFEEVAVLRVEKFAKGKEVTQSPTYCRPEMGKLLVTAPAFRRELPPLVSITKCPVLVERSGVLVPVSGYDRQLGILARGEPPAAMSVADAKGLLLELVSETHFATDADRSRYLANVLTPAFVMGGVGGFRAPIQFNEADESQSGKGYLNKITAAIYGDTPYPVNQPRGGVGGLEESFDSALIAGHAFISFDNLTPVKHGQFNSEKLCSFMTEDRYSARAPYSKAVGINPTRHIVMATTNGCTMVPDLVNRASPVTIRKRHRYAYRRYPEGSILEHVRANRGRYLGAVFTLINEWYRLGAQRTDTTAHDSGFTPWAQVMDWIVQNLLGCGPLLTNYEATTARYVSPDLQWLRSMAKAVKSRGKCGEWLTATELAEIAALQGVELPGTGVIEGLEVLEQKDLSAMLKQLGARLARCYNHHAEVADVVAVDTFTVERSESERTQTYDGREKHLRTYRVTDAAPVSGAIDDGDMTVTTATAAETVDVATVVPAVETNEMRTTRMLHRTNGREQRPGLTKRRPW